MPLLLFGSDLDLISIDDSPNLPSFDCPAASLPSRSADMRHRRTDSHWTPAGRLFYPEGQPLDPAKLRDYDTSAFTLSDPYLCRVSNRVQACDETDQRRRRFTHDELVGLLKSVLYELRADSKLSSTRGD